MINAIGTMPTSAPAGVGASCAVVPPPLVGGGVQQVPLAGPVTAAGPLALAAPGAAAAPVAAAAAGAAALGAAPTAGAPAIAGPPAAALPGNVAAPAAVTGARLTTVAPGGSQQDADIVEATLATLRGSAAGAQIVDRLLAVGARINVVSDQEFAAMGHADAHAFYDPKVDTIYMRRSDLSEANRSFAAVALAHEGTHLLDDVGGVAEPFIQRASARVASLGGPATAAGRAAQEQVLFELTMIKEARAFTFAGQVARDLRIDLPQGDPTRVAAQGANDQATYENVWRALLASSYNPGRRSAVVANF